MATNSSSKRPVTMLRCGNIKVTIWENVSEKGPFFATTVRDHSTIRLVIIGMGLMVPHANRGEADKAPDIQAKLFASGTTC